MGCEGVERLIWVRGTGKWWAVVNTVMNLLVSWNTANFWRSLATVRCDTPQPRGSGAWGVSAKWLIAWRTNDHPFLRNRTEVASPVLRTRTVPVRHTLHSQNYVYKVQLQFRQNLEQTKNRTGGGARMWTVQWPARIIILLQLPCIYEQSLSHSYVIKLGGRRFAAILCVGVVTPFWHPFHCSVHYLRSWLYEV